MKSDIKPKDSNSMDCSLSYHPILVSCKYDCIYLSKHIDLCHFINYILHIFNVTFCLNSENLEII